MQVVLAMFRPDGERRSFSIVRDLTVVGRREDCDLRIPLGDVSRKHCRLIKDDDSLRVEDLGSSNGTYRNGQRVQEAVLAAGDRVKVGPVTFVVQIDGVPADEEMTPDMPADEAHASGGGLEVADSEAHEMAVENKEAEDAHSGGDTPNLEDLDLAELPLAEDSGAGHDAHDKDSAHGHDESGALQILGDDEEK
jgi:pSer/pThr/pTyr-binding forkhead associated (FHA) protein